MKWISVKDQLPELGTWVIGSYCKEDQKNNPVFYINEPPMRIVKCYENEGIRWSSLREISHWMELPEEPNEME